jgi:dihydrofolate reductase
VVIIIGSGTYNSDPANPTSKHLFVVMTRPPSKYEKSERAGLMEFTGETPLCLLERFEKEGDDKILVAGGSHITTLFLKEQLIDKLWLTFELPEKNNEYRV